MRVLTVYAHTDPHSFCHALLERFTAGLADAGHESEVIDLYAIRFDPVYGPRDYLFFANEQVPREVLEGMKLKESVLSSGGPLRRALARRWLRGKDVYDIVKMLERERPKDVLAQQEKVARADGLAFIAPVFWMGFPAILKGWLERVFSYGFAYDLTREGWNGEVAGRIGLLTQKKAVIFSTTFFHEADYAQGFAAARRLLIDEWSFKYPGFHEVEHIYYYAPHAVSEEQRQEYLQSAYRMGKEFAETTAPVASAAS